MGLFDFLGGKNESVKNTNVDPNAFQYGGRQGAAGEEADYYRNQSQGTDQRGSPLADYGQANQARTQQQTALDLTRSAAYGQQPSVAQIQQQQGTERAIGDQLAAAASARGTGPGMAAAQRSAQQQGSAMAQQAVGQGAALRAQEMADARNSLAAQAAGLRGQDIGASQFQAQQSLAGRNANDARAMQEEMFRQGVQGQQLAAQQNYAQLQSGVAGGNAQTDRSNAMGVIGAVGSVLSDIRAKGDISAVAAPGGGGMMLATGGGAGGLTGAAGGGGMIPIAGAGMSGVRSMSLANSRKGPEGGANGEREKPTSGQDIRNQIKDNSQVETRVTPVAGSGAGYLGGNAPLFAAGGMFGKSDPNAQAPTSTMTKPSDALMGFLGGAQSVYSDERAKSPSSGMHTADALLDTLKNSAATYRYTDPSLEPREGGPTGGKYLGVMAQDLERVPQIGHQLVSEQPNGLKSVEGGAATSALMGGMGRLTERLERIEKHLGGARG